MLFILKSLFKTESFLNLLSRAVNFLKETFSYIVISYEKIIKKIEGKEKKVTVTAFSVVSIIAILFCFLFSGARVACRVNYRGKTIATVKSSGEVDTAYNKVVKMVNGKNVAAALEKPEGTTVVTIDNINTENQLVDAIIENSDDIVAASMLYVNGKKSGRYGTERLKSALEERLNVFKPESSTTCVAEFMDSVELEDGYCLVRDLSPAGNMKMIVDNLGVRVHAVMTTDNAIPYGTLTEKTAEKTLGYRGVLVRGENGVERTTKLVILENGQAVKETLLDAEVLSEPTTEVVLIGTATPTVSSAAIQVFTNGYNFPLPSGTWKLSAPYGDGRGHKGVDLSAPKGTAIMAVSGGKVVFAGWKGNYGYCVEIEHSGGIVTRYAHASALCVSNGNYVSAGQTIGAVGRTGSATGNHLHFEVIINNKNTNPAPYIGLR